eukprot:CAMPEP_0201477438 /NCGR_PEP_ID=MMETSP0151_2-20130828/2463_1 /ASSEMBLY_ACC=CAM_ASM_000257 /TAXON_ID=200890 /ORGANISM="Paramoeba atlantica, Strain 621/1 / CCAP 1560/9" /LENGTH=64 /DNA_ID=CAMNT_0047858155 /DNA_START=23 /DNA_END=214 /DNA_ORIENTATION=-
MSKSTLEKSSYLTPAQSDRFLRFISPETKEILEEEETEKREGKREGGEREEDGGLRGSGKDGFD